MDKRIIYNGRGKVAANRQLGGIELATLVGGASDGCRVAWVNTGGGLRFKVLIDRCMDIADAFFGDYSLAFLSLRGVTPPNYYAQEDGGWLKSFGGGLLHTCGVDHVGPPETFEGVQTGLHGGIGVLPAELISVVQPDVPAGNYGMSITGRVIQSTFLGRHFELQRTIRAELGVPAITIEDRVTNLGNIPQPHQLLYHFNFGYPLVDAGTEIVWDGAWRSRGGAQDDAVFNERNEPAFRICRNSVEEHSGAGESVAFIDPATDAENNVRCGLTNHKLGLSAVLCFDKEQLPALTNWLHFGCNEYVVGLEPGTHHPIGNLAAQRGDTLLRLQPHQSKDYTVRLFVEQLNT